MYSINNYMVVPLFLLLFSLFSDTSECSGYLNSSVNNYQSWYNRLNEPTENWLYEDGSSFWPILSLSTYDHTTTTFVFGFFANGSITTSSRNHSFYLVVGLLPISSRDHPVIPWCANRDNPVRENATLRFSAAGLELEDVNGTLVWSTNTSGVTATRLNMTDEGNLRLLDGKNDVIWESFDYPVDIWLPNQKIHTNKGLTSYNSSSDLSTGLYTLTLNSSNSLVATFHSYPLKSLPSGDYNGLDNYSTIEAESNYALLKVNRTGNRRTRFIRLEPTGHVNVYRQTNYVTSTMLDSYNLFININDCDYPMACGNYGICSGNGQCSCPGNSSYFSNYTEPNVGCRRVNSLHCEEQQVNSFLELENVSYFNLESIPATPDMNIESCKKACLDDCTCNAAFFSYGSCFLQSQLYSLRYNDSYNSLAFIKVQNPEIPSNNTTTNSRKSKNKSHLIPILASTLSFGFVTILVASWYYCTFVMNSNNDDEDEGDDDEVIGALRRFSFLELKSATRDFEIKLGQGGSGSVFEGDLADGTKVAVKSLDSVGQGRKAFLAEVNTIGSINHFNLVRLIGYCAEKSKRLLVYEHMRNGSLDKWLFNQEQAKALGWVMRKKIISDLAKGLEYLHVLCNPSIIHFDIKPQNILLDKDFNVKLSDFGLAKLVDRDKSQVLTALKGTPGYVAPELCKGTNVSTKADVFSFGIVILEIVSGRRNRSWGLTEIVREKAENDDQLYELVDGYKDDIDQFQKEEAVKMIKIGLWCTQAHRTRPSITTVLKVLDGSMDLGPVSEFHFAVEGNVEKDSAAIAINSPPPSASILSGPRS